MIVTISVDDILFTARYSFLYLIICCCHVVALALIIPYPACGSMAVLGVYWIGILAPVDVSVLYAVPSLVVTSILAYLSLVYGLIALFCMTVMDVIYTFIVNPISDDYIIIRFVVLLFCIVIGYGFGVIKAYEHKLNQTKDLERQMAVARELHDGVCNDIAYLIQKNTQRLNLPNKNDNDILQDLAVLRQTLLHVRYVISVLESGLAYAGEQFDSVGDGEARTSIVQVIHEQEKRLLSLGFDGFTFYDEQSLRQLSEKDQRFVSDLLGELYGNAVKHAVPDKGFAASLSLVDTCLYISFSDSAQRDDAGGAEEGTGLGRYHRLIRDRGGTCIVEQHYGVWSIFVMLPLSVPNAA